MAVDNRLASAEETAVMVRKDGGDCVAFEADVTKEQTLAATMAEAQRRWGRIDILHYNVGMSIAGGDAPPTEITEEAFDRIMRDQPARLRHGGQARAADHARADAGVIITISSLAACEQYPYVAYKATKAAMIAFTQQVAIQNAEYGIRANVHPARADGHADGGRHPRARQRQAARRGRRRARRQGAAARQDGHRLGRRQRGAVPRLRRGQFHHRRRACRSTAVRW